MSGEGDAGDDSGCESCFLREIFVIKFAIEVRYLYLNIESSEV